MTEYGERGLSIQNPFFKNLGKKTSSDGEKQDIGRWRMRRIAREKDSQTRDIWNLVDKSTKFQFFIAFYYSLG